MFTGIVTDVGRIEQVEDRGDLRARIACAYDAVHLVPDWETGTPDRADLVIEQDLFMGVCGRCGRCYEPFHPLDPPAAPGLRCDEPALAGGQGGPGAGTPGAGTPEPEA